MEGMTECPDSWKFIKVTNLETGETHDRILCSWYGGYLGGDSWKISSGNMEVIDHGDRLEVPQHSGTVYHLRKKSEKMSGMMANVLHSYSAKGVGKIKMEVFDHV